MNIHAIAKQIRSFADELEAAKPEQPKPFTLPTPPPGMRWHREDWTAEMLPQGMRPLVKGEDMSEGDQYGSDYMMPQGSAPKTWRSFKGLLSTSVHMRTSRPRTFTHNGHEWTWHRPGDPMPCDGDSEVVTLLEDLDIGGKIRAGRFDWGERDDVEQIIGWRYADAEKPDEIPWIEWHGGPCPLKDEEVEEWEYKLDSGFHIKEPCEKPSAYNWRMDGDGILAYRVLKWRKPKPKVPLGPENVMPFSAIRRKPEQDHGQQWHWRCVSYVHGVGVQCGDRGYNWEELQKDYQINRSIPQTGKWNPDAWENCEK